MASSIMKELETKITKIMLDRHDLAQQLDEQKSINKKLAKEVEDLKAKAINKQ